MIQAASGLDYESYVKQAVLEPLSITKMRLGKTRRQDRCEGEVAYYDGEGKGKSVFEDEPNEVEWPYGPFSLEVMDSHGGWLASAEDLAKWLIAFSDAKNCPILSADSLRRC